MAKKSPPAPAPDVAPEDVDAPGAQDTFSSSPSQLTSAVSLESVLGSAPEMPEVQEHAVAAARERLDEADMAATAQQAPAAASASGTPVKGKTDERGRAFDPAIHEVGPDGGPVIGKRTGFLRMRKGGAASPGSKSPNRSKVNLASPGASAGASAGASLDAARNADVLKEKIASSAAISAEIIFVLSQGICGEEFAPESSERAAMVAAWTHYYTVRGITDIPPEVMIAVALGGYVMKRWSKPIFTEKRKGWVAALKGEKPEKRADAGEHA